MKAEQLAKIKVRAELATKGPWETCNGTDVFTPLGATNNDGITANRNDGWYIGKFNEGSTSVGDEEIELSCAEQRANAVFIANARQDIPNLLSEVERLQTGRGIYSAQIRQLFGEIERLKSVIRTLDNHAYDGDFVRIFAKEALAYDE